MRCDSNECIYPFASSPGLWIVLCDSNYPWLEHISKVPKMFETQKFDSKNEHFLHWIPFM